MKTHNILIFALTLFFLILKINAQDRGPSQRSLVLTPNGLPVQLSSHNYPFSGPDSLVIGFQWPNNLSIANAVYCNHNSVCPQFMTNDTTFLPEPTKAQNGAYLTLNGLDASDPTNAIHSVYSHCIEDTALLQDAEHWCKPQCFQ